MRIVIGIALMVVAIPVVLVVLAAVLGGWQ